MSAGKKDFAKATQAEQDMLALGNEQAEKGRNIERPNLLHLKEVATIGGEDRANAAALAKAGAATAGSDAVNGAMTGLRAGAGVNSGAFRLGVEDATGAAGSAAAQSVNDTDQNMDNLSLESKAMLAEQALTGSADAMAGLRAGSAASGSAELARVQNRNLKSAKDASMFTNLATLGLKGLSGAAARNGMTYKADGSVDYAPGAMGWLAKHGMVDDSMVGRLQMRAIGGQPASSSFFPSAADRITRYNAEGVSLKSAYDKERK